VTLLEASAGAGKTFCMTTIWLRLVLEEGMAARTVLMVTFTRAATVEIRGRLRERLGRLRGLLAGPECDDDEDPLIARLRGLDVGLEAVRARIDDALGEVDEGTVATIHSFCRSALRQHIDVTGRWMSETEVDEEALAREVGDDLWSLVASEVRGALFEALLRGGVNAERCRQVVQVAASAPGAVLSFGGEAERAPLPPVAPMDALGVPERLRLAETREDVVRAMVDYARQEVRRRCAERGGLTLVSMLADLEEALRNGPTGTALAGALGASYGAVLIDEFQDIDLVQWRIFERLFGGGAHYLFLIGDPKQSIYVFRGVDM